MKNIAPVPFGRFAAAAGILLTTLVGGMLAAPPAVASPPAVPGVPDVGAPGEEFQRQTEPTIDPRGNPIWPNHAVPRRGWTDVVSIAAGARIRTRPVTGTVVGLIPLGARFWISCKTRAADGHVRGYANHARRLGWVRDDLWNVVAYTAPGAPAPRPIPWC